MSTDSTATTMVYLKALRAKGSLTIGWDEGMIPPNYARKLWLAGLAETLDKAEPRTGGTLTPKV